MPLRITISRCGRHYISQLMECGILYELLGTLAQKACSVQLMDHLCAMSMHNNTLFHLSLHAVYSTSMIFCVYSYILATYGIAGHLSPALTTQCNLHSMQDLNIPPNFFTNLKCPFL